MARLAQELKDDSYLPMPPRRRSILKPNGETREIGILAVQDRIAQRAVLQVIEPLFERRFLPCSFAYRPGRSTAAAVEAVVRARDSGYTWLVRGDVTAFFDAIDHQALLREVADVVHDRRILRLIGLWLEVGLLDPAPPEGLAAAADPLRDYARIGLGGALRWGLRSLGALEDGDSGEGGDGAWREDNPRVEGARRVASGLAVLALSSPQVLGTAVRRLAPAARPLAVAVGGSAAAGTAVWTLRRYRGHGARPGAPVGTVQGAVLSPLLANAYLHPFDLDVSRRYPHVVRYADDLLLACRDADEAAEALAFVRDLLATRGLRFGEGKTAIHNFDTPFTYLGYRFADGMVTPPASRTAALTAGARAFRSSAYWQAHQRAMAARRRLPSAHRPRRARPHRPATPGSGSPVTE